MHTHTYARARAHAHTHTRQAPFDGETDQERLTAVKRGVFKYPAHANLSPEATSFVNGLLCAFMRVCLSRSLCLSVLSVGLVCLPVSVCQRLCLTACGWGHACVVSSGDDIVDLEILTFTTAKACQHGS